MHAIIFSSASGQKDDGDNAQGRILTQTATEIKPITPWNHDVQQKQRWGLPLGIGKNLTYRQIGADGKSCGFQVILNQPGDIWIVFQHENRLTQCLNLDCLRNVTVDQVSPSDASFCKRTMNPRIPLMGYGRSPWARIVY